MDKELKQELEWINSNLVAAVSNQEYLYLQIKKIEKEIEKLNNKSNT